MKGQSWVFKGLLLGLVVFVIVTFLVPHSLHTELTTGQIVFRFVLFMTGGLVQSYALKKRQERLDRQRNT